MTISSAFPARTEIAGEPSEVGLRERKKVRRVVPRRNIDDQWLSDAIVGLEELDGGGMARSRSESTIPCN